MPGFGLKQSHPGLKRLFPDAGKVFGCLLMLVLLAGCGSPAPVPRPEMVLSQNTLAAEIPADQTPPTPTQETTPLPTPTSTEELVQEPAPSATAAPTEPLPTAAVLPEEHYILNVQGHKQYFPLGCETSVAVDWAAYFGVAITEYNFQYELPKSDNPEIGFVGDVRSPWGQVPPYGYGVHAGPVADLLQKYGLNARAVKNYTIEEVRAELAQDDLIIAWVIGNMVGGIPAEYTDKDGNTVIVAAYEHVVLLTGYNADTIRYNSNGRFYEAPNEVFLNSWGVLENMAVIMED